MFKRFYDSMEMAFVESDVHIVPSTINRDAVNG